MTSSNDPSDQLWKHYTKLFERFDDYSLARWMTQTLGHFNGGLWRYSHPMVGAYKLAAQVGNQRQLWLKRLVDSPSPYSVAECCRSPLFPLATRDVVETGLICLHCNETVIALEELPEASQAPLRRWSESYGKIHRVAHLPEEERSSVENYDVAMEEAAQEAGDSLAGAAMDVLPLLLDHYPSVVWEDHDECLGVRPEDLIGLD